VPIGGYFVIGAAYLLLAVHQKALVHHHRVLCQLCVAG
jgi:hypothetical protein